MDEHEQELRQINKFMNDLWRLIKKHYACENQSDEFWNALVNDASDLGQKYGIQPKSQTGSRLIMKNLVNAFLDAQEGRDWLERHGTFRRDREYGE